MSDFIFNDIPLSIPPEKISIRRDSFSNKWQALRTHGSIKLPSGFSRMYIQLSNIHFTSTHDPSTGDTGYQKLQKIIAQIRSTPFVWVENQHLRNQVALGNKGQAMMFVVRSVEITTNPNFANVITANIEMDYFNYFPYLTNVLFKKDIWLPIAVTQPKDSIAWKRLYEAELDRHSYSKSSTKTGTIKLTGKTTFIVTQFAQISVEDYRELETELKALKKLQSLIQESLFRETNNPISFNANDIEDIIDEKAGNRLLSYAFGNTTTMTGTGEINKKAAADALQRIQHLTSQDNYNSRYSVVIDPSNWSPVVLQNGEVVTSPEDLLEPASRYDPNYSSKKMVLLSRERKIILNDDILSGGLIGTGISLNLNTRVATLPMSGYEYPTFQCLGGNDATVAFSIATTSEESLQQLTAFYQLVQEQSRKFRLVPVGQRTVRINNEILNSLGFREFVIENMETDTGEGSDEYNAILHFESATIESSTKEAIVQSGSFLSDTEVRKALADVINKDLKFTTTGKDAIDKQNEIFTSLADTRLGKGVPPVNLGSSNPDQARLKGYTYKGPGGQENVYYKALVKKYASHATRAFRDLADSAWHNFKSNIMAEINIATALLTISDYEIPGTERIIRDFVTMFKKDLETKALNKGQDTINQNKKDLIEALNAIYEGQDALTSSEYLKKSKEWADATIKEVKSTINDPLKIAIEEALLDWQTFVSEFLDEIILGGIEVPQFAKILKEFNEKTSNLSSGGCYPDFPMEEIAGRMEQSQDVAFQRLQKVYGETDLASRRIDKYALITPDFYLFNPQIDGGQPLVEERIIKDAIETIQRLHASDQFGETARSWFEGKYEDEILGKRKAEELKTLRDLPEREKRDPGGILLRRATFTPLETNGFAASNLISTNNLLPSAIARTQLTENPISVKAIDSETDKWGITQARAAETKLSVPDSAFACQHDFTAGSISYKPENAYIPPPEPDPNKMPNFQWPTDENTREISSPFGKRVHPENTGSPKDGQVTFHPGIDIVSNEREPPKTLGRFVYASAPGYIKYITYNENNRNRKGDPIGGGGHNILIVHEGGWTTRYLHMLWSPTLEEWSDRFWKKGKYAGFNGSAEEHRKLITVQAGDRIGNIGSTGYSTGAHLHFEINGNGSVQPPEPILNGHGIPSQGPVPYLNAQNESLMTKAVESFEKEMSTGQGQGLIRAYPTFRLYFIESDMGERKYFGFDDFFSYNSVLDIGLIRSRKVAADVLTLALTNVSGTLSNRKFRESGGLNFTTKEGSGTDKLSESVRKGATRDTINENTFEQLMLQPGMQIQLRMGYASDPNELDIVFNGVIAQVEFTENDDIVNMVCQSFALELAQTYHGESKEFGGFLTDLGQTANILEELMAFPEVTHFGRWERGIRPDLSNDIRSVLRTDWKRVPSPKDDNIFAPGGKGIWGLLDSSPKFIMYQSTIWDVFQEMTLRHPGYIAQAVPYEGRWGPRMTMFFGLPDQMYFHRDPTPKEDNVASSLKDFIKGDIDDTRLKFIDHMTDGHRSVANMVNEAKTVLQNQGVNLEEEEARDKFIRHVIKTRTQSTGVIKAFRNYHLLTSSQHIISNSVHSDAKNTFNVATIQHSTKGIPWSQLALSSIFSLLGEYVFNQTSADVDEKLGTLVANNADTTTIAVDAGLADEEKREWLMSYPNCIGSETAKFYAVSALWRSMKDGYSGTISIIGNPKIKPYDICYVFDEYSDMYGPVEVEQVVHRFNEHGFVTEITPDMVCHVNQASTMASADAMSLVAEHTLKSMGVPSLATMVHNGLSFGRLSEKITGNNPNEALLAGLAVPLAIANIPFNMISNLLNGADTSNTIQAITPMGMIGAFMWNKFMTKTQFAHPITYSPLVMNGKPMLGGTPTKRVDNSFIQSIKGWFKDKDFDSKLLIEHIYDNINPNNWFGHAQGSFTKTILGRNK